MNSLHRLSLSLASAATLFTVACPVFAAAAQTQAPATAASPTPQERAAAVKKSLAESQAKLRQYEWMESTTVLLKDEEKSHTVKRCYYGADGKVQKITIEAPPAEAPGRGLRGKIKEQKKAELTDYMKEAVELVKQYVPPDHELIQSAIAAGKVSIQVVQPGARATIKFADFIKAGDSLGIDVDPANNRLLGLSVNTFLGTPGSSGKAPKDPVTMKVTEGTLDDGTLYPEKTELDAPSKHLKVVVENSGYKKLATTP